MTDRQEYIQEVREGIRLTEEEIKGVFERLYPEASPFSPDNIPESYKEIAQAQRDKILSDPRIALIDPEPEPPDIRCPKRFRIDSVVGVASSWAQRETAIQQDMLKANFRKFIPKEEYVKIAK